MPARGFVVLIDGDANVVTTTLFAAPGDNNPVTVDESTNLVYVGTHTGLFVIDGDTDIVLSQTPTTFFLTSVTLDAQARRLYSDTSLGIRVFDLDSNAYLGVIRVTGRLVENALAVNTGFGRLYGLTRSDEMAVVDTMTQAEIARVALPARTADSAHVSVVENTGVLIVSSPSTNTLLFFAPPSITGDAPDAGVGSYSFTYGLPTSPYTSVAVTDGALPPGLTLDDSGLLSGVTTAPGRYTFTITAQNAVGPNVSRTETLVITAAPTATPPTIQGQAGFAHAGAGFSYQYTLSGSPTPTVAITSGELPAGVTLAADGKLSGTPTTAGVSTFTITAANGSPPSASLSDTLEVAPALVSPSPSLPSGGASDDQDGERLSETGIELPAAGAVVGTLLVVVGGIILRVRRSHGDGGSRTRQS